MLPPRNLSSCFLNLVDSIERLQQLQRLIDITLESCCIVSQAGSSREVYQEYADRVAALVGAYHDLSKIEMVKISNHIEDVFCFIIPHKKDEEEGSDAE